MAALDNEDSDDEIFGMSMSNLADALSNATIADELEEQAASEKNKSVSTLCECFLKGITSAESKSFNEQIDSLSEDVKDEVKTIIDSFKSIQEGKYREILMAVNAQQFLCVGSDVTEPLVELRNRAITYITTGDDDTVPIRVVEVTSIGVAALNLFLQINYTGPELTKEEIPSVPLFENMEENARNTLLSVDGELSYTGSDGTSLLVLARVLLGLVGEPTIAMWTTPVSAKGSNSNEMSVPEGNDIWKISAGDERAREKVPLSLVNACKQLRGYSAWWSGRAIVTHQRLFIAGGSSTTLWAEFCHCFKLVLTFHCSTIDPKAFIVKQEASQLSAEAWLEFGLSQFHFDKGDMGKACFEAGRKAASLHVEMTGAMGKRTKFQQRSIAQMVVKATTIRSVELIANATGADKGGAEESVGTKPHTEGQSEDSILFEHTQYDAEEDKLEGEESLVGEQLSVLLALCLDVKNSNPKDGLTTEEMRPYVERVLIHPYNWTIYSTGLLQRAWLDFESTYARDRATLQLQALVDQHGQTLTYTQLSRDAIEKSAGVVERLRYLHCVVYPPRWELRKDLAMKYQELGILVSASELFMSLELWDDVVECYSRMGRRKDALAVVQEQRDKGCPPTPRMLCSIGNLLEAPESTKYYEEAWELSGGRYAKAMRSAGREAVQLSDASLGKEQNIRKKLNDPAQATQETVTEEMASKHASDAKNYLEYGEICLGKSLAVQPSVTSDWFVLGTIRMRLEKWQQALTCFSTVVSHEPDAGDAWGNVGAIHMRLKRPDLALQAFTEGLKASRESWRMWENRLLSGLQIKPNPPAPDVVYAATELLNLQERNIGRGVDTPLLASIVSAVLRYEGIDVSAAEKGVPTPALPLKDEPFTSEYFETRHVVRKTGLLLERSTSSAKATDPKAWELFAIFNVALGRRAAARDCRMKQCRQLQVPGWEKKLNDMNMIADAVKDLVQLHTLPLGASSDNDEGEQAKTEQKELYNLVLFVRGINKRATALGASGDPARAILNEAKEKIESMVSTSGASA
jgi:pentatricopeptide repeat protein